ncbi:MAG: electron transfer flavoprotein subunit beta, partial [Firmicutes bacterium]|nr:electron transfer flavoprotein subunit beta [Bacillota bacterium]
VGPARVEEALRKALAMGADEAVLIAPAAEADEFTLAKVLAAACKTRPFDLILGGNLSVDNGAGQVAIRVAHELGIPYVGAATKVEASGNSLRLERDAEGDLEVITTSLPLLITAQQGLAEPRLPSLPGIMKAKKKPITRQTPADLGVNAPPRTDVVDLQVADSSRQTKMIAGTAAEQALQVVRLLREEAKVI